MTHLIKILTKTELLRDDNMKEVLSRAVRRRFDETKDRKEAETLVLIAYIHNLNCLEQMLNDLDDVPELPF